MAAVRDSDAALLVICVTNEPESIDFSQVVQPHEEEDGVSSADLLQTRLRRLSKDSPPDRVARPRAIDEVVGPHVPAQPVHVNICAVGLGKRAQAIRVVVVVSGRRRAEVRS